jgi:PAS domain S-box-containing protein
MSSPKWHRSFFYSEENYRLVFETAPDAAISVDESGTILFANSAAVRVFGL